MLKYFLIVFLIVSSPAFAQGGIKQFKSDLQSLNQTRITFSPRFKSDRDIFSMSVLDKNEQLIGKVEDMKVDESGALVKLLSEINRVGRRINTTQNESYEITFHEDTGSFEIPLNYDERQQIRSPEALAAITPASGNGDIYSLKAMIGADVRNRGGRWLGTVKNVMFDRQAQKIEALVLEDVPGGRRYTDIALPFDPEQIKIIENYGRIQFRVEPEAAKALTDLAKKKR